MSERKPSLLTGLVAAVTLTLIFAIVVLFLIKIIAELVEWIAA